VSAAQVPVCGPFATEEDARHAADAAGLANLDVLAGICQDTGVALGEWDRTILTWLAGWERATAMSVAGMIWRAYLDGLATGCGVPVRDLAGQVIPCTLMAEGGSPLLDPACRAGKHASCMGEPCQCRCHEPGEENGRRTLPGHPVKSGAGYDCCCGACLALPARRAATR